MLAFIYLKVRGSLITSFTIKVRVFTFLITFCAVNKWNTLQRTTPRKINGLNDAALYESRDLVQLFSAIITAYNDNNVKLVM